MVGKQVRTEERTSKEGNKGRERKNGRNKVRDEGGNEWRENNY
jgi:hypothetical protein